MQIVAEYRKNSEKFEKLEKLKNSKTDDEKLMSERGDIVQVLADAIVKSTRYWQRLKRKNKTSYALMTSPGKNCRCMECAKLVNKN